MPYSLVRVLIILLPLFGGRVLEIVSHLANSASGSACRYWPQSKGNLALFSTFWHLVPSIRLTMVSSSYWVKSLRLTNSLLVSQSGSMCLQVLWSRGGLTSETLFFNASFYCCCCYTKSRHHGLLSGFCESSLVWFKLVCLWGNITEGFYSPAILFWLLIVWNFHLFRRISVFYMTYNPRLIQICHL